ncbi:MAG TPA: Clp protease N-terminal domain-containing protein [Candidatus Sulfotelmatobacter sp.]|nr:Clp protease N-terminal domain-containing protein [Candidatus Sulfotelmatobacter sp.]
MKTILFTILSLRFALSVDLPLSDACKQSLKYGMEEAERLNHRHIGSEHLFFGLLREKGWFAAELLEPFDVKLEQLRTNIEVTSAYDKAKEVRWLRATGVWLRRLGAQNNPRFALRSGIRTRRSQTVPAPQLALVQNIVEASRSCHRAAVGQGVSRHYSRQRFGKLRGREGRLEERSVRHLPLGFVRIR